MTPDLEQLFHELADLPPAEQDRRLEQAESLQEATREELRQMLYQDRCGGGDPLLDAAVRQGAERMVAQFGGVGDMAGPYRLVRELGRGGMGAVYLGEREDGTVSQQVAVKLMAPQTAAVPGMMDRFLRERRIQASLSHPNIARLVDAGVTSGGQPYLAMEYCDGVPIDEYCRSRGLGKEAIVRLFLPVCEAVSYAHRHLVVHRDLKPSNILVDAAGEPKLLDFGIAKVVEGAPGEDHTQTAAPMLTLHYASPEQVRGDAAALATDVYSLGAVLYRLLTKHYAHETATDLELPRAIVESDPVRPSAWSRALAGDLENILLMAMRREPARRYATVDALAEDLRRFLERRPVHATPPGWAYRTRRFVERNPVAAAASVLAIVSLAGGTAFSVYQARQAQQRLNDVRQMANVFLFDFEKSIRNIPGTLAARHKVIETARTYLEKVAPQAGNEPAVVREVADAYRSLAEVQTAADFSSRGRRAALESMRRSRELRRRLGDQDAATEAARLLPYIEATTDVCRWSVSEGEIARAREACTDAERLAGAWSGREPQSLAARRGAQSVAYAQAWLYEADSQPAAARAAAERAYGYAVELARRQPDDQDALSRVLSSGRIYADMLIALKLVREALEPAAAGLAAGQQLIAAAPQDTRWRRNAVAVLMSLGSAHRRLAEERPPGGAHLQEASRHLEQAFRLSEEDVRRDPSDTRAKDHFIVAAHRWARLREMERRYPAALELMQQARRTIGDLLALDPRSRRYLYLAGNNRLQAGQMLEGAGRQAEAAAMLEESTVWLGKALAAEAHDAVARENLLSAHLKLARIAARQGRLTVAHERWRMAEAEVRTMTAKDPGARKYIGDYDLFEKLGREWRLLPPPSAAGVR